MTARGPCLVIDLAARRAARTEPHESSPDYLLMIADELVDRIETARPDLSYEACCSIAKLVLKRSIRLEDACRRPKEAALPPLVIAPDDPVYALFDAHKAARDKYRDAIADIARNSGRSLRSAAQLVQSARRHCRGK